MLPGLKEGQDKMSKSDPSSAIFMEDEEDKAIEKIKNAHCPQKVDGNPCLEYIKYLILPRFGKFRVERGDDHGGEKTFSSFDEVFGDYESGKLPPDDLKSALSKALNEILQPVRDYFRNDSVAKELLETVKGNRVTR